jgi:hypothetical protein
MNWLVAAVLIAMLLCTSTVLGLSLGLLLAAVRL